MDQPRLKRLRQESNVDSSDRQNERRAAVAQMMAENREGLGMRVIAVMVQRYGVLPKALWDLNSKSDMGAGRGTIYYENFPKAVFESIIGNDRFHIITLTIGTDVAHQIELPNTLRRLEITSQVYDFPLGLPSSLLELIFYRSSLYNQPLLLPAGLRKLILGYCFNRPLNLPPALIELGLGEEYSEPLLLPQRLQRLTFPWLSEFNHPLTLPPSIKSVEFGTSYNQPTILPLGVEAIAVRPGFTQEDLFLPSTLRKIEWCCGQPIQIPDGVVEVEFGDPFDHPVTLPSSLRTVIFGGDRFTHAVSFPDGLEELEWYLDTYDGVVTLPERLQKLTWWVNSPVTLPAGLRGLVIGLNPPLVLPETLLKVRFGPQSTRRYDLPASVSEVSTAGAATFTHPTTLQHLVVEANINYVYPRQLDLSHVSIHKLTIGDGHTIITQWPQGLKELEFTVDDMVHPMRVPEGCRIVGELLPANVILE